MELLMMQFSPPSCHFIPLRSKYSLRHPILKMPQFLYSRHVKEQVHAHAREQVKI
jgi:hypothetical protein